MDKISLPKCSISFCDNLKENNLVLLCIEHLNDFRFKDKGKVLMYDYINEREKEYEALQRRS